MWCQHTDQLRDTRIAVTTTQHPVIQTSEHPIQFESCGDPVTEANEQTAKWRLMFHHQFQLLTLQLAVHKI